MCADYAPPFTLRFGNFKGLRSRSKGVPEPPNILLVVDFSNYVSGGDFGDPDFDEDLMLNQIQLMSLHSQENLLLSTVEDLKLAAQQWLWNPLGLALPTSQFVLVLDTNASLDPHWHGRKMVLIFVILGKRCSLCGKFQSLYISSTSNFGTSLIFLSNLLDQTMILMLIIMIFDLLLYVLKAEAQFRTFLIRRLKRARHCRVCVCVELLKRSKTCTSVILALFWQYFEFIPWSCS